MKYPNDRPVKEGYYWVTEDNKDSIMISYWKNGRFFHLAAGGYTVQNPSYWLPVNMPTIEQMKEN